MDHWEQQRLREIEYSLENDDPEFVERLRTASTRPPTARERRLNQVVITGAAASLLGLLVHPLLSAVGLSIVMTAFLMNVVPTGPDRQPAERGDEDDSGGTGATLPW